MKLYYKGNVSQYLQVSDRGDIVFLEHMAMKWLFYVKKEKTEYKKEKSRIRRIALKEK